MELASLGSSGTLLDTAKKNIDSAHELGVGNTTTVAGAPGSGSGSGDTGAGSGGGLSTLSTAPGSGDGMDGAGNSGSGDDGGGTYGSSGRGGGSGGGGGGDGMPGNLLSGLFGGGAGGGAGSGGAGSELDFAGGAASALAAKLGIGDQPTGPFDPDNSETWTEAEKEMRRKFALGMDPDEYFKMIGKDGNLFKVIHRRYQKIDMRWIKYYMKLLAQVRGKDPALAGIDLSAHAKARAPAASDVKLSATQMADLQKAAEKSLPEATVKK